MKLKTKKIVAALAVTSVLAVGPCAYAFEPGTNIVNVVIPFAPGGGVDQTFRNLQKYAAAKGIQLVAVYKPGADGLIAMNQLSGMPKDGLNISLTTAGVLAYHSIKNPDEDLVTITGIRGSIGAFVAHPNSSIKTIDDLEKAVRSGNNIKFGYGAPGQRMVLDQYFELAKAAPNQLMVPYKGGGPVINDLLGGQIDVAQVPFSIVKAHIDSGKLRLLATVAASVPKYNVPLMQKKYPKWQEFDGFGVVAPKGTSTDAIAFWSEFLKGYVSDKQVQEEFASEFTLKLRAGPKALEDTVKASKERLSKIKE
jgi:tripartite-type tricarboxylate transporter receptor subunit TctC